MVDFVAFVEPGLPEMLVKGVFAGTELQMLQVRDGETLVSGGRRVWLRG